MPALSHHFQGRDLNPGEVPWGTESKGIKSL